MPDREREQRRGAAARQQVHADTRPGQHGRRLRRELRRAVPGVPAEHHPGPGRVRPVLAQPAGQARGGGPDHGAVHPVRPGADRAAQACGAELEPAREPVGQPGRGRPAGRVVPCGRAEQVLQFATVGGIGIVRDPGPDALLKVPGVGGVSGGWGGGAGGVSGVGCRGRGCLGVGLPGLGLPGVGLPGGLPGVGSPGSRGRAAGAHVVRGSTCASRAPIRPAAAWPAATTSA